MKTWRKNGLAGLAVVALGGAAVIPVAASNLASTDGPVATTTMALDVAGPALDACGDGSSSAWGNEATIAIGDRACWRVSADLAYGPTATEAALSVAVPAGVRVLAWTIGAGSDFSGYEFIADGPNGPTWRITDPALDGQRAEIVIETIVDDPRQVIDGSTLTPTARLDWTTDADGAQTATDTSTARVLAADLSIQTTVSLERVPAGASLDTTTVVRNGGSLPATVTYRTNLAPGITCADVTDTDGGTCVDMGDSYVEWVDVVIAPDTSDERTVVITVPGSFESGAVIEHCSEVMQFITPTADGTGFVTIPSRNTDATSGPNANPIEDCDTATVGDDAPAPTIDKTATTGIDAAGNGPTDAVTGESVTYEIIVSIPEGSEFGGGTLTDQMPAGIEIDNVALTTRGGTPINFPTTFDSDSFAVTWPDPYRNAPDSGVDEFLVTVEATVTATSPGNLVNEATFTSNLGTTTDDAPITVIEPDDPADPPLSISKTSNPTAATIGQTIDVELTVTVPASASTRFDTTILDTLPTGVDYAGITGSSCVGDGGTCSVSPVELSAAGSTTIGFFLGDLAPDTAARTITIGYQTQVTGTVNTDDTLVNSAVVVSNDADQVGTPNAGDPAPVPGDFDDTAGPATSTVEVVEPLLVIDQDVNGQVGDSDERSAEPGEKLTYTITVTNDGDGPAYNVIVTDDIDPRLFDFIDMTDGNGITLLDGDPSDGQVSWRIDGPIQPGESVTIEFMVTIPTDVGDDPIFNTDADIPSYTGVPTPDGDSRTYGDDPTDDVISDPVVVDVTDDPPPPPPDGNSSLGDTVWFDRDGDGVFDDNEVGLPGVRVVVSSDGPDGIPGTADDIEREAITGENGEWIVDGLPAGSYTVTIDEATLPDGVVQTYGLAGGIDAPQPTVTVDLPADTNRDDVDFGYIGTGSIGDTIWWDRDEDGVQSDSLDDATREPGIENVDVIVTYAGSDGIFGTADDVVFTDETDENGEYLVTGLPAGEYRVEVETQDLPDGMRATYDEDSGVDSPDSVTLVTLGAGEDHLTADFGYVGDGSIGDTIYLDLDGDGVQDPDEPGVPGQVVVVTWEGEDGAFNTADDEVFELVTDENGNYLIDGLPDDRFRITVGTPDEPGITDTATNTGDPDGGAPNTSEVTLGAADGRDRLDQDFGYQGDNRLGDTIWNDADRDGIDDGVDTEPRLPSVDVIVTWYGPDRQPGGGDDVVVGTSTTDENGEYLVDGLPDGRFAVEVDTSTLPVGFQNTVDPQGLPGDQSDSADDRSTVQLGTNDAGDDIANENLDQDFGYAADGVIGDSIYLDRNGDGVQNADEPGIEGVVVEITFLGADGIEGTADDVIYTVTTDENGEYLVDGLPAGDYIVRVTGGLPAGADNTGDPDAPAGELGDSTSRVTLGLNPDGSVETNLDQDFGYDVDTVVGDRVWFDRDRDGLQDADEPGIEGVEITVTFRGPDGVVGGGDDQTFTDTTDADGNWLITDIPTGAYVVEVTGGVPSGFGPTYDDDSPADGTNTAGDERSELDFDGIDLDQDFGYAGDAVIEGTIWLDLDGDGVIDPDESGLAGVDVVITWYGPDGIPGTDDDVSFTLATDDNGDYSLDGLPAGDYSVTVDETELPEGVVVTGDPDGDGDLTTELTLGEGETASDVDFGVQGTSSIGDTVFFDLDRDGTQDPASEPGIEGVTVTLTWFGPDGVEGTDDDLTFDTTTDENGEYLFDGLPAGEYVVSLDPATLPEGTEPTVDEDGGIADEGGVPDRSTPVTLGVNDDHLTADFGEAGPGTIGDTVYLDLDGDGVQDPDEPGLPGQPVTIIFEGADGVLGTDDDVEFPAVTDSNGDYTVDGLPLGDFTVVVGDDTPGSTPDITDVADNTGDPDGGTPNESRVTLTEAEPTDVDQDFGYQGPNALGDTVWYDDDGDGIDDGAGPEGGVEERLDGVDVTVTWFGPDGVEGTDDDVEVATATTDDDGEYRVDGLPDGTYDVVVDQTTVPEGLRPSVDTGDVGTPAEGTSPNGSSEVTLEATDDGAGNVIGDENLDQDFGFNDGSTLSGSVVLDTNDSGDLDDGDAGLPGVRVDLIGPGPDGEVGTDDDEVVATTLTDENGDYSFTGLEPGDYVVDIDESTLPSGVDEAFDPDGVLDGQTPVTVGEDEDVTDVDFGYAGEGVIGDTIYLDLDGDGTQDADEPGVAEQPVTLTWAGPDGVLGTFDDVEFTTTTDENGEYLFENLPDGLFEVQVGDDEPADLGDPNAEITDLADNTGDPDGGNDSTAQVILSPLGRTDLDQDFGYQGVNSLGDTVFLDDDADGVQDPTDEGIEGVDVTVTWFGVDGEPGGGDDVVIGTETTDENGEYLFDNLPDGTYEVTVDEATLPSGVAGTVDVGDAGTPADGTVPDGSSVTVLESDQDGNGGITPDEDLDQDFGYAPGGEISGTIVLDLNDNGQADEGEGIEGVVVDLVDPGPDGEFGTGDDVVVDSTVTDENGDYSFPGLDAGDYVVVVDPDGDTLPEGTTPAFDTDDGQPGNGDLNMPVTLDENPDGTVESADDVDAGVIGEGVIGDTIYLDLDGDGVQGDDEPGVPGQTVTLSTPGDDGVLGTADDEILAQTETDENGEYRFENLPDGDYVVTVGTPGEDGDAADDGIADRADNTGDPDGGEPNQSLVTLTEGDRVDLDQDFGYQGVNELGDTVFFDENADGIDGDDATEPGIPGVPVDVTWAGLDDVLGTDDDVLLPASDTGAVTDEDGEYSVTGLPDGTYLVEVIESADALGGLNNTVDSADEAGDPIDGSSIAVFDGDDPTDNVDLTHDFGYVDGGSVSGTVVLDLDDDGVADEGEGIEGVVVDLVDPGPDGEFGTDDDVVVDSTVTDENGDYSFPGLDPGDYVVVVDPDGDSLPEGVDESFDPDDVLDSTTPVTVGENEDVDGVDFGYAGDGSIGDTVYLDLDGDGVQDDDEPGVPGQTVTLTGAGSDGVLGTDDDIVFTDVTDENGEYLFENLPDGLYEVTVGVPGEDGAAADDGIADDAINTGDPDGGNDNTAQVTLSPLNRDDRDQDFGYQGVNSLGDTVFLDDDADGVQDPTDEGIEGVDVTVTWFGVDGEPGGGDDVVIGTETTDENGEYLADNLPDGTYEVTVDETTLPDGVSNTTDVGDAGTPADGTVPDGSSVTVLESDQDGNGGITPDEDLDQDFGYAPGGEISGTIVLDLNDNGQADEGEGIEDVVVDLVDPGPDGEFGTDDDVVVDSTVTDENGDYSFPGLDAGDYVVVVDPDGDTLPEGTTPAFDTDDGQPGNGDLNMPVTLDENPDGTVESADDVDAGVIGEGVIGDTIYLDLDGDGVQGDDEPGVPGQTVTLSTPGDDGVLGTADDEILAQTETDENGEYRFDNLPDGDYLVTVGTPGEDGDAADDGIADRADNTGDPDGGEPNTSEVTLAPGDRIDLDQDFGYQGVNELGDTVFFDENADGIDGDDATEPGIPGVPVDVTWAGLDDVLGTDDDVLLPAADTGAVTDENGEYSVTGLPDGTYQVIVDETADALDGLANTVDSADEPGDPRDGSSIAVFDGDDPTDNVDLTHDFGYVDGGVISGTIVFDLNDDGTNDAGDEGIPGVRVVLFDGQGNQIAETVTDENGDYSFPGLDAGDYVVDVDETTLPEGLRQTFDTDASSGVGEPGDGDGSMPVTLDGNPDGTVNSVEGVDAGYIGDGVIGDTIFLDLDGDGTQDVGDEPGVPGQTVTLTGAGADGVFGTPDDIVRETTTDPTGGYLFEGLPDGEYIVTVGVPGEEPGATDDGIADLAENTADPDGGEPNESRVTLSDPADGGTREDLDQDFGYAGPNSLGDTVFLDDDGDGVQDPTDEGIEGVDVQVTWYGPDGQPGGGDDVVIGTETTDENGEYLFENLPDGTYEVDVIDSTVPAGLDPTVDVGDEGTPDEGTDPDGTSTVTLESTDLGNGTILGDENLDQDFGYAPGGSISGRIVFDLDGGDDNDADEPGVPGVTVTLTGPDGLELTTVTDENGEYSFDGLPAGDYVVTIDQSTLPDGVELTFDTDDGVLGNGDGIQPVTIGTNPDGTLEDVTDVDSGVVADGRIGDTIYFDDDGNGVQGPDEAGIPGQVVTLVGTGADGEFGTADDIVRETITDENGEYLFEGLPDGDYVVTVGSDAEPGITERAENTGDPDGGVPNTSEVTLSDPADGGTREDLDQDFGYRGPNSIGDTVFLDENADGVQDPTDEGVPGVDVIVTWHGLDDVLGTDDDVVYTTTTDDNGEYTVDNLPDGTFTVTLDPDTLPADADPTVDAADQPGDPVDSTSTVVLGDDVADPSDVTQGEDEDGVDFGIVPGGSISGTVVLDRNGNDTQDVDEPGLEGVTVILTGPGPDGIEGTADDIRRETTTDENGDYSFPGLPAGDYQVTIDDTTLPPGTEATFDTDPDGADNPDRTTSVTLTEGPDGDIDDVTDVDFGEQGDGVIAGTIYIDTDGDGEQGPDEPGQPGQPVSIVWAGPDGVFGPGPDGQVDDVVFQTVTEENGDYVVDGLPDGDYRIDVGPGLPDVATATEDPDGGGDNTALVTIDPDNREQLDQDFGYTGDNSIGDTVFIDANLNGVDDGAATDPRVEGADVTVTWFGPDGVEGTADDVVFPTVTTDENGEYTVSGLPDGTYSVVLDDTTLPTGTAPSVDPDGGTPDGVSVVTVEGGENNDEQDFGVSGGATLGDTVWLDLDGDGVRDLGEPGLAGAVVTATFLGADGQPGGGDDIVFTTTVDQAGNYLFEGLPAGEYIITVSNLPGGLNSTFDPDGGDDRTSRVVLGFDETNLDQDFGFDGTASLDGTVFNDLDGDGVQDPNESGVPGATVVVVLDGPDGPITVTVTTDENGDWSIDNLPPGDYTVGVDPDSLPDGVVPATGPVDVTLPPNGSATVDIPVVEGGTITGIVVQDRDRDNVADPDEPRQPGVTVILIDEDGNEVDRTTTDDNGVYIFDDVPPGVYRVRVLPETIPDGQVLVTDPDGTVDGATVVTVNPGETTDSGVFGVDVPGRVIPGTPNNPDNPNPGQPNRPLPRSGSDLTVTVVQIALLALLVGGALLIAQRRRPDDEQV